MNFSLRPRKVLGKEWHSACTFQVNHTSGTMKTNWHSGVISIADLELPAFLALHSLLTLVWSFQSTSCYSQEAWRVIPGSQEHSGLSEWKLKNHSPPRAKPKCFFGFIEPSAEGLIRYNIKPEWRLWVAIHSTRALLHSPGCWLELSYCTTVGFANLSS